MLLLLIIKNAVELSNIAKRRNFQSRKINNRLKVYFSQAHVCVCHGEPQNSNLRPRACLSDSSSLKSIKSFRVRNDRVVCLCLGNSEKVLRKANEKLCYYYGVRPSVSANPSL